MKRLLLAFLVTAAFSVCSCAKGPPPPASLDTANEVCRHCRMAVSSQRFAAQLAAPGEEPLFFDDVGCLRDFLAGRRRGPQGEIAYVADHRTRAWVPAAGAVYTRLDTLETPMGSHLIAHASPASRAADPAVRGGAPLTAAEVFGPAGPPKGSP